MKSSIFDSGVRVACRMRVIVFAVFLILTLSACADQTPQAEKFTIRVSTISILSPGKAEEQIIRPLEMHIGKVPGLKEIHSSVQGFAVILDLDFAPGTDKTSASSAVLQAVNKSKEFLPEDISPPEIKILPDKGGQE